MRFGTNYSDTLKLTLSLKLTFKSNLESPGAVQTLKSVWGCYFDVQVVPGILFRRFCRNLKSQGKMLL